MDNQTKVIFGLLILMFILVGIFVLKITGVIKPAPVEMPTNIVEENEEIEYNREFEQKENLAKKIVYFITANYVLIIIALNAISIIVNIGLGKLYGKLSMPEWTVNYQYMYPFITIISGLVFGKINGIITFVLGIISIVVMSNYFKSVGMSKYWPLLGPIFALPIIGLSVSLSFSAGLFGAASSTSVGTTLLLIIGIGMLIAYLIACIIANIRVGIIFDKGVLFIIGLVIIPFVFQPILGYWGETVYLAKQKH